MLVTYALVQMVEVRAEKSNKSKIFTNTSESCIEESLNF